jgi:hypothetical protein
MPLEVHDIGDTVRLQASFRNFDGDLTSPTTTTLYIQDPSGVVTTVNNASISSGGTGVKYYDLAVDEAGTWWYRFKAAGNLVAEEEGSFRVRNRQVVV